MRLIVAAGAVVLLSLGLFLFYRYGRSVWVPVYFKVVGKRTVAEVRAHYRPRVEEDLRPLFIAQGLPWPPPKVTYIAYKAERRLELWAASGGGANSPRRLVKVYKILGQSGGPGPKLLRGDKQIPEGLYRIIALNPNSAFHLSLKLNYPNKYDRRKGQADGRADLGDNIFIHGKNLSVGCIAIGDSGIEELFVLTSMIGRDKVRVIVAPNQAIGPAHGAALPPWTGELYTKIRQALTAYR